MKVLGITGGVGSGKSEVLKYLEEHYGAVICQMDETARQIQRKGTECFRQIVEAFGEEMTDENGELNRAALGACVFSDPEKLKTQNEIVHPEVIRRVRREIEKSEASGAALYVLEAALLPEVGRELCDELWYIYTSEAVRRQRLKMSRHYTDEKITNMIASQPSEEDFRRSCTAVIDNSGTFENTKRQIGDRLDNENVQHCKRQQR